MGVIALAVSYAIPIIISMLHGRREVSNARWNCGRFGWICNTVAVTWIAFEVVIFSMPTVRPATIITMNYASVVWIGIGVLGAMWYIIRARKVYKGPPDSDGV